MYLHRPFSVETLVRVPHTISIFGLLVALSLVFTTRVAGQDYVEALVTYGDEKLLDDEEAITDERLAVLLDSLCTLDPAPEDLIRDLRLFQRIRTMDQEQMVSLIDSLFELETVPYALVNEINLYADQLPSQAEVDGSHLLAWDEHITEPGFDLYGEWNTTNPNAYTNLPFLGDSTVQLKLIDAAMNCDYRIPVPPILTSRFGWRDGRNHNGVDLDLEVWDTVRSTFSQVWCDSLGPTAASEDCGGAPFQRTGDVLRSPAPLKVTVAGRGGCRANS
jgi:hypothetical protein